jgi:hypothetical protein
LPPGSDEGLGRRCSLLLMERELRVLFDRVKRKCVRDRGGLSRRRGSMPLVGSSWGAECLHARVRDAGDCVRRRERE